MKISLFSLGKWPLVEKKNLNETIINYNNLLTWQLAQVGGRATVQHVDPALDLVKRGGGWPGGTEAGPAASNRRTHATPAARKHLKKNMNNLWLGIYIIEVLIKTLIGECNFFNSFLAELP